MALITDWDWAARATSRSLLLLVFTFLSKERRFTRRAFFIKISFLVWWGLAVQSIMRGIFSRATPKRSASICRTSCWLGLKILRNPFVGSGRLVDPSLVTTLVFSDDTIGVVKSHLLSRVDTTMNVNKSNGGVWGEIDMKTPTKNVGGGKATLQPSLLGNHAFLGRCWFLPRWWLEVQEIFGYQGKDTFGDQILPDFQEYLPWDPSGSSR